MVRRDIHPVTPIFALPDPMIREHQERHWIRPRHVASQAILVAGRLARCHSGLCGMTLQALSDIERRVANHAGMWIVARGARQAPAL